jgi:hypothetical protein
MTAGTTIISKVTYNRIDIKDRGGADGYIRLLQDVFKAAEHGQADQ